MEKDYLIYSHYMGEITIPYAGLNPIPGYEESYPSFGISQPKDGSDKLVYYMFNKGIGGDAYNFIMLMEGLSFSLAKLKYKEIVDGKASAAEFRILKPKIKIKNTPTIYSRQQFKDYELVYWQQENNTTEEDLIEADIYPLDSLYYKDYLAEQSAKDRPKYIFPYYNIDKSKVVGWKMYNPLADKSKGERKWLSGGELGVGNLWNIKTKVRYLFITTSKKDGITLYKNILNKKYPYIHPPSEGNFKPIVENLDYIKKMSEYQLIIPDIDDNGSGQELANKLHTATQIPVVDLDYGKGNKDLTESFKTGNKDSIRRQLINFIT